MLVIKALEASFQFASEGPFLVVHKFDVTVEARHQRKLLVTIFMATRIQLSCFFNLSGLGVIITFMMKWKCQFSWIIFGVS